MLIAQLVKNYLPKIFDYCSNQDPTELNRLLDKNYGKEIFKLSFPFCKEASTFTEKESKRFYKPEYDVLDIRIRICSQWAIKHKVYFLDYLLNKSLINQEEYDHYQKIVQKKRVPNTKVDSSRNNDQQSNNIKEYTSIKSDQILVDKYRIEILKNFSLNLIEESKSMAEYYQIFYSLERNIRIFISEVMEKQYGDSWWDNNVEEWIYQSVDKKIRDEQQTLFTKQSEKPIDYATFSELGHIITHNWKLFDNKFVKNERVLKRIMQDLNKLRIPIAHCNPFNEKEKDLFYLTVGYWFDVLKKNVSND